MQPYEQLEKEFGEWVGNPNCVAVNSGTAALHLALEAFRMPKGSIVLVPDYTMVACARAVSMSEASPRFVDCTDELLIDPKKVNWWIGEDPNVKAIMAVHIYGRRCDMEALTDVPEGVWVVEDLAEAHGIWPHPNTDAACWSFYKNKIVHGEEGGMIAFKEPEHAEIARQLRSLGFFAGHDFMHRPRGVNYRLANLLATPILESLAELNHNLQIRQWLKENYDDLVPSKWHMPDTRVVNWVYDLRIPGLSPNTQDAIVWGCRKRGVEARHGFKPMSSQPEYMGFGNRPNAKRMASDVMYLPLSDDMTTTDVEYNVDVFLDLCQQNGID
jgi:perosamine synthetase